MDAQTEVAIGKPFDFENIKNGIDSLVLQIKKARKAPVPHELSTDSETVRA